MPDGGPLRGSAVCSDEFVRLMEGCDPQAGTLAVAVSGGADSMALCLLAHDWAMSNGVQLSALTVDHGLRTGSDGEAAQVGAWLCKRGINHRILTWKHNAKISSRVQERARNARYALMRGWCLDHGVNRLLVAHHLEDQAETVLMRLKKGSGLLGLAAMAPARDLDGVRVLRPLLSVPKARLRATLIGAGQSWIEDPSNENPLYERVRTRQLLAHLEREEGVSAGRLAGAAGAVARVRDILDAAADELVATADGVDGGVSIGTQPFLAVPMTVRRLALAKLLRHVGGGAYAPARLKLERMLGWMAVGNGRADGARTLGGCAVRRGNKGKETVFLILPERPRKCQKQEKNSRIKYETALAPSA